MNSFGINLIGQRVVGHGNESTIVLVYAASNPKRALQPDHFVVAVLFPDGRVTAFWITDVVFVMPGGMP